MPKLKYEKYIIAKPLSVQEVFSRGLGVPDRKPGVPYHHRVAWLDDEVLKGSFYMEVELIEPGPKNGDVTMTAHVHDHDEIIGFIGTNPQNPGDMGGEVEIWLEDEKYVLNKSCLVFVPKGLTHCPLFIKRVDYPIVHFTVFNGGSSYIWTNVK